MEGMSDTQLPAPPPHPYAAPVRRPSRALAISAMALGLAALLTVAVTPLMSGSFAVLGSVIGIAAVICGVIALVLRQPVLYSVVGLAAGALAIVVALVIGMLSIGSLFADAVQDDRRAEGSATESPGPADPESTAVVWPQNMSTGGIVFSGKDQDVRRSDAPADNATPAPLTASDFDSPALIRVYVDYRCPYCAKFEQANAATLDAVLEQDAAAIELHPLTFLDRVSEGSYYSSRAAGTLACLAEAQPEVAWDANAALMSEDVQPAEGGPGLDNDAIITAIEDAVGPLHAEARTCITEERFVPFAQALSEWVFANPVPGAVDPSLGVTGTPFVVVDGVPYPGDPADTEAFRAFLVEQGLALK